MNDMKIPISDQFQGQNAVNSMVKINTISGVCNNIYGIPMNIAADVQTIMIFYDGTVGVGCDPFFIKETMARLLQTFFANALATKPMWTDPVNYGATPAENIISGDDLASFCTAQKTAGFPPVIVWDNGTPYADLGGVVDQLDPLQSFIKATNRLNPSWIFVVGGSVITVGTIQAAQGGNPNFVGCAPVAMSEPFV